MWIFIFQTKTKMEYSTAKNQDPNLTFSKKINSELTFWKVS